MPKKRWEIIKEFLAQDFQFQLCPKNAVAKYAAAVISKTRFFSRW